MTHVLSASAAGHRAARGRPILIVATSLASFTMLRELAARLVRRGVPIALASQGDDARLDEAMRAAADALGGTVHRLVEQLASSPPLRRAIWKLQDDNPTLRALLDHHDTHLRAARQLIRSVGPRAVVVAEDGITGNCWIIEAARRAGVPVVDCPYGYGTRRDLENDLANKERQGELRLLDGPYAEEIRRTAPQWIKRGRFAGAVMYAPEYIVARERLGISLRDAWVIHGGFSDRVCVESRQMLRHYLDEELPADRLEMTGAVYCDVMFEALAREPAARAALHTGRKIAPPQTSILVSWPTSYHAQRGALCEFATFAELSQTVLGFLASLDNVRLTVSLHPAMPEECRRIVRECPVTVSQTSLIELIPQHDLYISEFSSTIRWAIAAGKPVINYDFYRFDLTDFDAAPGVVKVNSFAEFQEVVRGQAGDERRYTHAAQLQNSVAADWGTIDGRAVDNILTMLVRLRPMCHDKPGILWPFGRRPA